MPDPAKFERLSALFAASSIPTDRPGFDLHRNFRAAEAGRPLFLLNYGRYIHWRSYDPAYLAKAEHIVRIVAEEVHRGLRIQNLQGACIVTSMILQRILERHGVWACMVKGAFHATKSDGSRLFGIYPLDRDAPDGKENGHVWLHAPPYHIVDLTLNMQGEGSDITSQLPDTVLAQHAQVEGRPPIESFFNPKLLKKMEERGYTPPFILRRELPHYETEMAADFPSLVVQHGGLSLRYAATSFGGPDDTLERTNGYIVNGMSAFDFYQAHIKPKLDAIGA